MQLKLTATCGERHDALWKLCVEQHDQLYQEDQLDAAAENLRKAIYSYSELRRLAQPANHKHDDELMTYFRARLGSLYVALQRENEAIEVLKTALATAPRCP